MAHHRIGFLEQFIHQTPGNGDQHRIFKGIDSGRARPVIDQGDLAEQFALKNARALDIAQGDLDRARFHEVSGRAWITLLEDDVSGRKFFPVQILQHGSTFQTTFREYWKICGGRANLFRRLIPPSRRLP